MINTDIIGQWAVEVIKLVHQGHLLQFVHLDYSLRELLSEIHELISIQDNSLLFVQPISKGKQNEGLQYFFHSL